MSFVKIERANTVILLSKAKQSHNCILSNFFNFYILQIFKAFNFLSVVFRFAKNLSLRGDSRSNPICLDCHAYARNDNFNYIHAFSYALKNKFAILNNKVALAPCVLFFGLLTQWVKTHCYKNWIATPSTRNDGENNFAIFNYIHAFSGALKNQFEIMSCNESYDFNHNNFYHNGNNRIFSSLRGFAKNRSNPICLDCHAYARNDDSVDCHADKSARTRYAPLGDDGNELFSRNDYGGKFIFDFGNNFNYGFLFNRKINSTKKNFNQGEER